MLAIKVPRGTGLDCLKHKRGLADQTPVESECWRKAATGRKPTPADSECQPLANAEGRVVHASENLEPQRRQASSGRNALRPPRLQPAATSETVIMRPLNTSNRQSVNDVARSVGVTGPTHPASSARARAVRGLVGQDRLRRRRR